MNVGRAIDLVAFDLDGTLLDPNGTVRDVSGKLFRPSIFNMVARCQQAGIRVTLATGRPEDFVLARAQELGIKDPMICSHGTVILDGNGQILSQAYLPATFEPSLRQLYEQDLEVAVYLKQDEGPLRVYLNRASEDWAFYQHLLGEGLELDPSSYPFDSSNRILKFVIFSKDPNASLHWQGWAGPELHVARTHHQLIEVTVAGYNKGTALSWVAAYLQIDPARVLAVGDQENDVPMFAVAGHSAAMGNAPDTVKARASWVAPSYWEDGAVQAVRHFLNI